jgi:hypothetical protein
MVKFNSLLDCQNSEFFYALSIWTAGYLFISIPLSVLALSTDTEINLSG